jgi:pentatricopeptide repeat protein
MEPDRITYTTAMHAAGLALQPDRAFEFFRTLQAMGVTIEERTWCLLIKACGEAMDYDRAMSVFQEAQSGSGGSGSPPITVLMCKNTSNSLFQPCLIYALTSCL